MVEKLIIDVGRIDPTGEELQGEVNAIDIAEEFVHPVGCLRYSITAQVFGTELLVRGRLEQDFSLVCSRCGKDFDFTVVVDDYTTSVEVSDKMQEIDLTDDVRESVLLDLPTYPVCDEACKGIPQKSELPADDRWNALDGLKV